MGERNNGLWQVGDALNPYWLAERIPGFAENLDGIRDARKEIDFTDGGGMGQKLSLPYPVWVALCNLFPDEEERKSHIYPRLAKLHPEYTIQRY